MRAGAEADRVKQVSEDTKNEDAEEAEWEWDGDDAGGEDDAKGGVEQGGDVGMGGD